MLVSVENDSNHNEADDIEPYKHHNNLGGPHRLLAPTAPNYNKGMDGDDLQNG